MPCRDGGPTRAQEIQARLDEVTDLLCRVLRNHPEIAEDNPYKTWWLKHQLEDEEREREEKSERKRTLTLEIESLRYGLSAGQEQLRSQQAALDRRLQDLEKLE